MRLLVVVASLGVALSRCVQEPTVRSAWEHVWGWKGVRACDSYTGTISLPSFTVSHEALNISVGANETDVVLQVTLFDPAGATPYQPTFTSSQRHQSWITDPVDGSWRFEVRCQAHVPTTQFDWQIEVTGLRFTTAPSK